MPATDYSTVTELAGDEVTTEQLDRLHHRYYWAGPYCADKDVIEAGCGTGPGLGFLGKRARSLRAGDLTPGILAIAQQHYGSRFDLRQFDAQAMPYEDHSADAVILFEAIYYLPDAAQFVAECRRVLRSGGQVLISTANKDLSDFNPSPHSYTYYGVAELGQLFSSHGFAAHCFGYLSVRDVSLRQKLLRPVKILARNLRLIPQTMAAKKLLKKLVFGQLVPMPAEIQEGVIAYQEPVPLPLDVADREHKVIYCAAALQG
jgi:SAM-dependent methyltransferase